VSTSASVPVALELIGILSRLTVLVPMHGIVTVSKDGAWGKTWSNGGARGRSSVIVQFGEASFIASLLAWAESDSLSDNGPFSCIYGR
jgi:hypothetical protein